MKHETCINNFGGYNINENQQKSAITSSTETDDEMEYHFISVYYFRPVFPNIFFSHLPCGPKSVYLRYKVTFALDFPQNRP